MVKEVEVDERGLIAPQCVLQIKGSRVQFCCRCRRDLGGAPRSFQSRSPTTSSQPSQ
jgi:hypothetical protein